MSRLNTIGIKTLRLLGLALIVVGTLIPVSGIWARPAVGETTADRLTLTAKTGGDRFTAGQPKALTLTNRLSPADAAQVTLPAGVTLDWAATKRLWPGTGTADAKTQTITAADRQLAVTTDERDRTVVTLSRVAATAPDNTATADAADAAGADAATASTAAVAAATAPAAVSGDFAVTAATRRVTLTPVLASSQVAGNALILTSDAAAAVTPASQAAVAAVTQPALRQVQAPNRAPAPAPAPTAATKFAIDQGGQTIYGDNETSLAFTLINTTDPSQPVTLKLGKFKLDLTFLATRWQDYYGAGSVSLSADGTTLTNRTGASVKLTTDRSGQQILTVTVNQSGDYQGYVPLAINSVANPPATYSILPTLADGTAAAATATWTHVGGAVGTLESDTYLTKDPANEDAEWWYGDAVMTAPEAYAVGGRLYLAFYYAGIGGANGDVHLQLSPGLTLDLAAFANLKIKDYNNNTYTFTDAQLTTTGSVQTLTGNFQVSYRGGADDPIPATLTYNKDTNLLSIAMPTQGELRFYLPIQVGAGAGKNGYKLHLYDIKDGDYLINDTWTFTPTGDIIAPTEALKLQKVAATDETLGLAGAKFAVSDVTDATSPQALSLPATDAAGLANVPITASGLRTLSLKETTAPSGYALNPNTYEVQWSAVLGAAGVRLAGDADWGSVSSDGALSIANRTLVFRDSQPGLKIQKVAAEDDTKPLAGATFSVADTTTNATAAVTTPATDDAGLTSVAATGSGTRTLTVSETKAPEGYAANPTSYEVQWSAASGATQVREAGGSWGTTVADGAVSVKNQVLVVRDRKLAVTIRKVAVTDASQTLAGATFTVGNTDDTAASTQTAATTADGVTRVAVTGSGDRILTLSEATAPTGYAANATAYEVQWSQATGVTAVRQAGESAWADTTQDGVVSVESHVLVFRDRRLALTIHKIAADPQVTKYPILHPANPSLPIGDGTTGQTGPARSTAALARTAMPATVKGPAVSLTGATGPVASLTGATGLAATLTGPAAATAAAKATAAAGTIATSAAAGDLESGASAAAAASLAGATFSVTNTTADTMSPAVTTAATGADGLTSTTVTGDLSRTMVLTEVTAPSGYALNPNSYLVQWSSSAGAVLVSGTDGRWGTTSSDGVVSVNADHTLTFRDSQLTVTVQKTAAEDATKVLPGAIFTLGNATAAQAAVTLPATDADGLAGSTVSGSGDRILTLREQTAPRDYLLNAADYELQWSATQGVTAVRLAGDSVWATASSDGVLQLGADGRLLFADQAEPKTGTITVQDLDRATGAVMRTQTFSGPIDAPLSSAATGANLPGQHSGLTLWGSTMDPTLATALDPYDAANPPDPRFAATAQTLTYVFDLPFFELNPDPTIEFGTFAPDQTDANYQLGTHSATTGQPLPFGISVIDRTGVAGWAVSVQEDGQFQNGDHELTDAKLWFKNLNVQAAGSEGGGSSAYTFTTTAAFTLTPTTAPQTIVQAQLTPEAAATATTAPTTRAWRLNFGDATSGGQSVGLHVPATTARHLGHYRTTVTWTASSLP
ncbi:SpaA isopeptide-forming pilin-related protein [Lacticaseibacillus parakribbianus]|uniref:SpaA isopeptide-forming pilin-related protein n=1 Tax=Lacticaseibacillus parakribbianus TaxID=2970927 RepID=UPI0021CB99DE|nr:SpaA isopeptide-forming pilin-related protein [Lacticaseibacillus parakribbianus]